ncbi:uncharacterized protein LDX57_003678 [Aspergillus melleus]|uniref:uncharacterized protein n=1 Tax=Aspergillus melleus TaxID=138277 RepID=UPI001E8D2661|nr:uncharacterized protein LDX57_003678 [Aspergillus melleus]KAH8425939.1 hypothetical protein LDX57_003678 [Aspergillus melleus]
MALYRAFALLAATPFVLGSSDDPLPPVPDNHDVLQYVDPLIGSANGGICCSANCLGA